MKLKLNLGSDRFSNELDKLYWAFQDYFFIQLPRRFLKRKTFLFDLIYFSYFKFSNKTIQSQALHFMIYKDNLHKWIPFYSHSNINSFSIFTKEFFKDTNYCIFVSIIHIWIYLNKSINYQNQLVWLPDKMFSLPNMITNIFIHRNIFQRYIRNIYQRYIWTFAWVALISIPANFQSFSVSSCAVRLKIEIRRQKWQYWDCIVTSYIQLWA